MFRNGIGPTEILIIVGVIVLLFGGRKLPELARGSGKALRIFKDEIKELKSDESDAAADSDARTTHRVVDATPERVDHPGDEVTRGPDR